MEDEQQQVDHRALAMALFNGTWALMDQAERSAEESDRMVHMAHASRLHWDEVGTDENRAIGEWQCSRVYAALDRSEPALHHARRCIAYADRLGVAAWMRASAREALARALLVDGDVAGAIAARDEARRLLAEEQDEEDRDAIAADLDSLPLPAQG